MPFPFLEPHPRWGEWLTGRIITIGNNKLLGWNEHVPVPCSPLAKGVGDRFDQQLFSFFIAAV